MEAWIAHQQYIRRFNMAMVALLVISLVVTGLVGGPRMAGIFFLVELVFGGLLVGMANVALLLGTPPISASDEDIREAAVAGPKWLKRLVSKLDAQA